MSWVNVEDRLEALSSRESKQVEEWLRRRARPHFYTDESFPLYAVRILRGAGDDVQTAADARLLGHDDKDQLAHARRTGRVLLTCDRDFLDEKRFPLIRCPALAVFNFGSRTAAEIAGAFRAISIIRALPQAYDMWAKIDANPTCWTEYTRFANGTTYRTRMRYHRGKAQEWVDDALPAVVMNQAGSRQRRRER